MAPLGLSPFTQINIIFKEGDPPASVPTRLSEEGGRERGCVCEVHVFADDWSDFCIEMPTPNFTRNVFLIEVATSRRGFSSSEIEGCTEIHATREDTTRVKMYPGWLKNGDHPDFLFALS